MHLVKTRQLIFILSAA